MKALSFNHWASRKSCFMFWDSTPCPLTQLGDKGQEESMWPRSLGEPRRLWKDEAEGEQDPWKDTMSMKNAAFPGSESTKEPACQFRRHKTSSIPGSGRSSGGGQCNPLQYPCLENPHGQRSLVGCSPWGHKDSDMTEVTELAHAMKDADSQLLRGG